MHKQIAREGFRRNYAVVKGYNNFVLRQFYKRFEVVDYEKNMPADTPVIMAGNHQNALIDALNMVGSTKLKHQPTFITRSDVFGHALTGALYSLKMLPIYRERDNMPIEERIKKNGEIFDITVRRLSLKEPVLIFPEGNHNRKLRIRNLQKGFARMAFQAEEQNDFKLGSLIVPMGLNYKDHKKFNSDMLIIYGEPIPVANYISLYKENQSKALITIRNDLRKAMRKLVIDIQNEDYYEFTRHLVRMAGPELAGERLGEKYKLIDRFHIQKEIVAAMDLLIEKEDPDLPRLKSDMETYQAFLKEHKIRDHTVLKGPYGWGEIMGQVLLLLLSSPLYLLGLLSNYLPYKTAEQLAIKNFKDDHFHSSIMMASSMVIYPLFALLQTGLVWGISGNGKIALAFMAAIPFAGKFALYFSEQVKKCWSKIKFNKLLKSGEQQALKIKDLRTKFSKFARKLTTKREKVTT
ncbi:MAG: 1-acyl-sn-glycerol-3-phosphate acyltransferase [Bacteroidota bacterium]